MKSLHMIILIGLSVHSAWCQPVILKGRVLDVNTRNEIPFANIFVKGSQVGTTSDFAGRFTLSVPEPSDETILVFQHVAYLPTEVKLGETRKNTILLQPRVIPIASVDIQATSGGLQLSRDLPQAVSVFTAASLQLRGYMDAGDFLRTDHSVQVEEQLDGKKTVAIRGGNADEVVVLYNGIRLNSAVDNIFDLSLIDLEDVDRMEVVKGSHTSLFGSDALAGAINIVSKVKQDYHLRLQQRFGTYNSGQWGVQAYLPAGRLHTAYRFKQGALRRQYEEGGLSEEMENRSTHHTADLLFELPSSAGVPNLLTGTLIHSDSRFENPGEREKLADLNQVAALRFEGGISVLRHLQGMVAWHHLKQEQEYVVRTAPARRLYHDRSLTASLGHTTNLGFSELLLNYQFENTDVELGEYRGYQQNALLDYLSARFDRQHHGAVLIAKSRLASGSPTFPAAHIDLSLRYDRLKEGEPRNLTAAGSAGALIYTPKTWQETTAKLSANLAGKGSDWLFNGYLNYGSSVKFPTLLQRISAPYFASTVNPLEPERNRTSEIGLEFTRDLRDVPSLYGWRFEANIFRTYYDNKLRPYYSRGYTFAFYESLPDAQITGYEGKMTAFLARKKITTALGLARYDIPEKAAFPFKSENKVTLDLRIDHTGFAFNAFIFRESDQVGWSRLGVNEFAEITLPGRTDLDLHLSKNIPFHSFELLSSLSARNLLAADDAELSGLALRDRRFYLTLGLQY